MFPHYRYSGGGIITGAIYKFKLGPRATVAGAVMGGALGTLAGILNTTLLYLSGQDRSGHSCTVLTFFLSIFNLCVSVDVVFHLL